MSDPAVTLRDVYRARRRIAEIAVRTPLIESPQLTDDLGAPVYLKLENVQRTGAFKIRGAANKLQALSDEERRRGVITVSSGNHGRAVAYVARELGVEAVICMSTRVPANKVDGIRRLGAEVVLRGESYDEAEALAERLREARGLTMISPFDDPFVIAQSWLTEAEGSEVNDANAIALASVDADGLPNVRHVRNTNYCDITVRLTGPTDRPTVVVFVALDNMIKGAAGQAIQNMNLLFDIDEVECLV